MDGRVDVDGKIATCDECSAWGGHAFELNANAFLLL